MTAQTQEILRSLDARKTPVTWIALAEGGWKCVVAETPSEPGEGCAASGWDALVCAFVEKGTGVT